MSPSREPGDQGRASFFRLRISLIRLKPRPGSMVYPSNMGQEDKSGHWDRQIQELESRIARLRSEPGASSGLLGAELIELLERTLNELKLRRSLQ